MSYKKIGTIIQSLHEKTISGAITWEETEVDGTYQVSFPNYSVRIFSIKSSTDNDYFIQIINEFGKVLDEVSDIDLKDIIDNPYKLMKEIHNSARRQALGVEDALDAILSNLDDLGIPF